MGKPVVRSVMMYESEKLMNNVQEIKLNVAEVKMLK